MMFLQFLWVFSLLFSPLQAFESDAIRNHDVIKRLVLRTRGLYPRADNKKTSTTESRINVATRRLETGLQISSSSTAARRQPPRRRIRYPSSTLPTDTKDQSPPGSPSKRAKRPDSPEEWPAGLQNFLDRPPSLGLEAQGDIFHIPPLRSPSTVRQPRDRWPDPHPKLGSLAAKPVSAKASFKGPAMIEAYTGKESGNGERIVEHFNHNIRYEREYSDPHSLEIFLNTDKGTTGRNTVTASGGRRASVRSFQVSSTQTAGFGKDTAPPSGWKITRQSEMVGKPRNYLKASTRTFETPVSVTSKFKGAGLTILRASNSVAGSASSRGSSISATGSDDDSSGLDVSDDSP